ARRARKRAQAAERDGDDPEPHWQEFERRRHRALLETLTLERLAEPLRSTHELEPPPRPRDQARLWTVAMLSYAYHPGCWEQVMHAAGRLQAICEHLDGAEPSCVA